MEQSSSETGIWWRSFRRLICSSDNKSSYYWLEINISSRKKICNCDPNSNVVEVSLSLTVSKAGDRIAKEQYKERGENVTSVFFIVPEVVLCFLILILFWVCFKLNTSLFHISVCYSGSWAVKTDPGDP